MDGCLEIIYIYIQNGVVIFFLIIRKFDSEANMFQVKYHRSSKHIHIINLLKTMKQ